MSTTTTTVDMALKPETVTYALRAFQVPDGTDAAGQPKFKTEYKAISREADIEAARKDGSLVLEQTFSYDLAGTLDGLVQITKGDQDEAVNIFNAGLKIRLNSRIKAALEETDEQGNPDFQAVEGNYDFRDTLAEPAQRRNLSPTDKAVRVLIGLGMSKEAAIAMVQTAMAQKEEAELASV